MKDEPWIEVGLMRARGLHAYDARGQQVARVVAAQPGDGRIRVRTHVFVYDHRVPPAQRHARGRGISLQSGKPAMAVAEAQIEGGYICTEEERDEKLRA